jgi:hypothetical protein
MIKSLTQRAKYTTPFPNATMKTDWDLLEEIHQTYTMSHITTHRFEWIQGHQDESVTSRTSKLCQEARYNIRADELAGTFYTTAHTPHNLSTPIMRFTGCTVNIQQISIHGNLNSTIRRVVSESDFFLYLTRKHRWNDDTYTEIDWLAFRMAARNYQSSEVHLLKLAHDLLPTRAHLAKFQPWTLPNCHYCLQQDTLAHLQRATCNRGSCDFRASLREAVNQYFDRHHTPHRFRTEYHAALNEALRPEGNDESSSPRYQWLSSARLRESQSEIGTHLITRGFISKHWRELLLNTLLPEEQSMLDFSHHNHDGFEDKHSPSDKETLLDPPSHWQDDQPEQDKSSSHYPSIDPTIFLAGLIKCTWHELGTLWTKHLEAVHQPAKGHESPVTRASLQEQIRRIHALRSQTR